MNTSIITELQAEISRAALKHPTPMQSRHEGYAILLEEVDELWDEIKKQRPDRAKMRQEALHVAAMAIRLVNDVFDKE